MARDWDVIVVGGGPGGALAAKKCAAAGMKTLLLEKKKIPRDKCCSGMVMGQWGQNIVKEEFGEYPEEVMSTTTPLLGYALHVPGARVQTLELATPATWRKTLDTWMCQGAREAGAELWDSARVTGVTQDHGQSVINLRKHGQSMELRSRFVIGSDGALSAVRRALYPNLKTTFLVGFRECYEVKLELPGQRFNMFSTLGNALPFYVHDKGRYLLLEGVAVPGALKETIAQARQFLIENHGLAPDIAPLWRDGCMEPVLYRELATGTLRPAQGNILITGDAAGLNIPVSGEGLSTSLKSGRDAAQAVIEASQGKGPAADSYLMRVDELITKFRDINSYGRRIRTAAAKNDPQGFSEALIESWHYALNLY